MTIKINVDILNLIYLLWAVECTIPLKAVKIKRNRSCNKWYHEGLVKLKSELDQLYYFMNNSSHIASDPRDK